MGWSAVIAFAASLSSLTIAWVSLQSTINAVLDAIAHDHIKQTGLAKLGFVAGGADTFAAASSLHL